jgi:uncharacterized protein YndB with AHSA1/START domain
MTIDTLAFRRIVDAPVPEIMRAFTNATALREWLCDVASVDARRGGRIYLHWSNGFYAAGEYTRLEPTWRCGFTWLGRGEPAESHVAVTIEPLAKGVEICLTHSDLGGGVAWAKARDEISRGWEAGLENLHSVLETGQDLRYTRRATLGVELGEYGLELARKLGVPVAEGLRVIGVVEGSGAYGSGLRADDIVVGLAGRTIRSYADVAEVLSAQRGGDVVNLEFYRGPERRLVSLELSLRPSPVLPADPADLVQRALDAYGPLDQVERLLDGVSAERAARRPAPEEWSAVEVLAHLLICERELQVWITDMLLDAERTADGFANPTNAHARIAAAVATYPLPALIQAWHCSVAETLALLGAVTPEFMVHKGSFWRLGRDIVGWARHAAGHVRQMETALAQA